MKKFVFFMLFLASAAAALFAGGSRDKDQGPNGKITIYTSIYEDVIKSLDAALKKQFPDCAIEFVYGGTGQVQAKVAAEQSSGKLGCDILLVAEPSYSLELKEKGILHRFISKEAENLAFDYDKEGYWYPVRVSNMVLAYNPVKNNKNSVPNSFYDFANNASASGAVSMSNPLTSGTSMAAITALSDKYGYDYFDALGRQKVTIESGAIALSKLESGEYKVIMVLEESVLKKRQEESSKLEVIYPGDGTIIIPSTIMLIAGKWSANNNTKTAEIIADWFLSNDGQKAIISGWMHSVRKNFSAIPYDSIPTGEILANSMPLNWENNLLLKEEIQIKFEDFVTNR
ncbi:MAG: ABC transporter substrate-binding protein [Treponema sp.]|jgi:iron(III) transport system substrate-binding protein|nr:ABC transporter substrate-binding protein [Treponema sp.]